MSEFEPVASVSEIPPNCRKSVVVDDLPALLVRIGEDYYCIEDTCSHDGQAMTDGAIRGCEIECPRHGARFDLRNGNVLCMPATEGIATFEVRVQDGIISARPR